MILVLRGGEWRENRVLSSHNCTLYASATDTMPSNSPNSEFSMDTICMGVLTEHNDVNPQMSVNNTVAPAYMRGGTAMPFFRSFATDAGNN